MIFDFASTRLVDLTGLETISEMLHDLRLEGLKVVVVITSPHVTRQMAKYGIASDASTPELNLERFVGLSSLSLIQSVPRASLGVASGAPIRRKSGTPGVLRRSTLFDGLEAEPAYATLEVVVVKDAEVEAGLTGVPEKRPTMRRVSFKPLGDAEDGEGEVEL